MEPLQPGTEDLTIINWKKVKCLGITQIVTSVIFFMVAGILLAVPMGIISDCWFYSYCHIHEPLIHLIRVEYWSPGLIIICGSVGVAAAKRKTLCLTRALLVVSMLSAVVSMLLLIFSIIQLFLLLSPRYILTVLFLLYITTAMATSINLGILLDKIMRTLSVPQSPTGNTPATQQPAHGSLSVLHDGQMNLTSHPQTNPSGSDNALIYPQSTEQTDAMVYPESHTERNDYEDIYEEYCHPVTREAQENENTYERLVIEETYCTRF